MTKLKKTIMFAPALLFPAYILVFMFTTRVNVPFWDEWFYIPFVARCLDGHFSLQELAAWHVDHRIIFIHLAYLPTYLAFKGDTLAPLLIQFAAQCLILAMMLRQASKLFSPGSPWKAAFPAIAAALLFSPQMAGIWLFGASLQQSWASLFYAAAAFSFCVSRPSWPRTAGAVLAALGATTCGANALAVWPVLVAACLFNKAGAWKCATTALLACAVIALYYGAASPSALYSRVFIEGGWTAPGISFSDRFRYIAAFIGSMFSWNSVNGGAWWGWIGLAIYAGLALQWLLAGKSRDIRLLAWLALPGLTIASAVMGSYKRIVVAGVFQALDSRYIAMSDVFWVGLFASMFA